MLKSLLRLAILVVACYLTLGICIWSYRNALPFLYTQQLTINGTPAIRSGAVVNDKLLVVEYQKSVDGLEKVLAWDLNQNYLDATPLSEEGEKIVAITTGRFGYVKQGEFPKTTTWWADASGNWGLKQPPRYDEAVEILRVGRKRFQEAY